jgi:hypothetical protein
MSHVDGVDAGVGYGVRGLSNRIAGVSVFGLSLNSFGVYGVSDRDVGVYGHSDYGLAAYLDGRVYIRDPLSTSKLIQDRPPT